MRLHCRPYSLIWAPRASTRNLRPAQLNAVYNREARSPRTSTNPNPPQLPLIGRGPVPKFEKVANTADLQPKINTQPPFRRANPEGGFISVSSIFSNQSIKLTLSWIASSSANSPISPQRTSYAIQASTTNPRAIHDEYLPSRAKESRMMDTTTKTVTTSSTSMIFSAPRNQDTKTAT